MSKSTQVLGVSGLCECLAVGASAHGDHSATAVQADVVNASVHETNADVQTTLATSSDHSIVLYDLHSDLGAVHMSDLPIVLSSKGTPKMISVHITGTDALPAIFVLELDFGANGSGPLLVIPNIETPPDSIFFTIVDLLEIAQ